MQEKTGGCVCGKVTYSVTGEYTGVVSCHCKSCQRFHGNYNPMIVADKEQVALRGDISWYTSSDTAERGFCGVCGAALFKRQTTGPKLLISVGSLDDTTGLRNIKNVFVEKEETYYTMPEEKKD